MGGLTGYQGHPEILPGRVGNPSLQMPEANPVRVDGWRRGQRSPSGPAVPQATSNGGVACC